MAGRRLRVRQKSDMKGRPPSSRPSPPGEGGVLRVLGLLHGLEDATAPDLMIWAADWRPGWVRTGLGFYQLPEFFPAHLFIRVHKLYLSGPVSGVLMHPMNTVAFLQGEVAFNDRSLNRPLEWPRAF